MAKKAYPYENLSLTDIKGERWADIPSLDGYIVISNYGRVKRLEYEMTYKNGAVYVKPEKIIVPTIIANPNKFKNDQTLFLTNRVVLHGRRYNLTIARLVYYCFVQEFDLADYDSFIVCKDGNGLNIRPSNLQLVGRAEKQQRMVTRGRFSSPLLKLDEAARAAIRQTINKTLNKQVSQYTVAGKKIKTYPSLIAAEKATGIHSVSIGRVAVGRKITAGGYAWRYGNEKTADVEKVKEEHRREHRKKYGQKVSQYDLATGRRVACYPSLQDAEAATGAKATAIALVLRGIYKSAKGYFWQKGYGKHLIDISGYTWGRASTAKTQSKQVAQYTLKGKLVRSFPSLKAAAAHIGVYESSLSEACRIEGRRCRGFIWKYVIK